MEPAPPAATPIHSSLLSGAVLWAWAMKGGPVGWPPEGGRRERTERTTPERHAQDAGRGLRRGRRARWFDRRAARRLCGKRQAAASRYPRRLYAAGHAARGVAGGRDRAESGRADAGFHPSRPAGPSGDTRIAVPERPGGGQLQPRSLVPVLPAGAARARGGER